MSILRIGLGVGVGAAFLVLLFRHVDFATVNAILGRALIWPLLLALLAYAADFVLRAVRFWVMLLAITGRPLPLKPSISPFIASFGISDILPLRAGDGFRIIWFNRQFGIPAGTLIGAMLVERVLDLVSILALGGIALALVGVSAPSVLVTNFQLVLGLTLFVCLAILFAPTLLSRLLERLTFRGAATPVAAVLGALRSTSAAVQHMGNWRRLALLTAFSLACWLLESIVLLCAWFSLGGSVSEIMKAFLAFVFSTLGTLVPSLPGHFGSFEYFGVQAFTLTGVDPSFATAVVLLAHLLLWAPTAIFGVVWLLMGSARSPVHAPAPLQP
ncbi:lysylphosphatidylglycerol synthase transmembrane domain-containing protein [Rhizorhapis sp. SPR117]|uniref:lysylphosphatidylglycerol synthase transmembrane domain-containing protein n=1 Tax=Rhizorhapis sp. SPR117 TaxID=2912611 RepID=UPI001F341263|nr:flippase-like domain-containing protein [Rhizorhapis sp. SPR117]